MIQSQSAVAPLKLSDGKGQSDCLGQRDYLLAVNIGSTKSEISAQREIVKRHNDPSCRVIKKCQRIAGLKALLKEWELSDNFDHDYIQGLKARLVSVKNQLKNMSGRNGSEGADDR